jgi:hypothetical protein
VGVVGYLVHVFRVLLAALTMLHPVLASLAIVLLYLSSFTRGDVGGLDFGLLLVSAVVTAMAPSSPGSLLRPPDNPPGTQP